MAYASLSPHDELRMLTSELRALLEALCICGACSTSLAIQPPATELSDPKVIAPRSIHLSHHQPPEPPLIAPEFQPTASQRCKKAPIPSQPVLDPLARLSLAELEAVAKQCTACRLHQGRTHVVFGVGNPHAELMFVGEAPGRDEDLQGSHSLVGPASC